MNPAATPPSLRGYLAAQLEGSYRRRGIKLPRTGMDLAVFPAACPYAPEPIFTKGWLPQVRCDIPSC